MNQRARLKQLHEEYLVTRQTSTGNGGAWIPKIHEGPAHSDDVPGWFKRDELGMSFDTGPSLFSNERTLARDNDRRREVYENDALKHEQERIRQGCKAKPVKASDAGHKPFTHQPANTRPRRRDTAARNWVPMKRRRENAKDRAERIARMIGDARENQAAG